MKTFLTLALPFTRAKANFLNGRQSVSPTASQNDTLSPTTAYRPSDRQPLAAIFSTLAFGVSSLGLSTGLVILGATAASAESDYFNCAASLIEAGIRSNDATTACAGTRHPERLEACVLDVSELTDLTADSAFLVCQRSRRPLEVADCTINIHDNLIEGASTTALQNCGLSLLPERYGHCVVDIADATESSTDEALTQCLRAGYQPWLINPRQ